MKKRPWPPIFRGWSVHQTDIAVVYIEDFLKDFDMPELVVSVIRILAQFLDVTAHVLAKRRRQTYIVAAIWLCSKFFLDDGPPTLRELAYLADITERTLSRAEVDIWQTLGGAIRTFRNGRTVLFPEYIPLSTRCEIQDP